jgi:hypothetical protein
MHDALRNVCVYMNEPKLYIFSWRAGKRLSLQLREENGDSDVGTEKKLERIQEKKTLSWSWMWGIYDGDASVSEKERDRKRVVAEEPALEFWDNRGRVGKG